MDLPKSLNVNTDYAVKIVGTVTALYNILHGRDVAADVLTNSILGLLLGEEELDEATFPLAEEISIRAANIANQIVTYGIEAHALSDENVFNQELEKLLEEGKEM